MGSRISLPILLVLPAILGTGACDWKTDPDGSPELLPRGCTSACCEPGHRGAECWPLLTEKADLDYTMRLREVIAERIHLETGERAADIGAGMGWFTTILAKQVGPEGRVYATDIDPRAIATLRKYQPPQVETRQVANPIDTGLDDVEPGTLSMMLMINSITLFDGEGTADDRPPGNDLVYLAKLARLIMPGGRFLYHQDWLGQGSPDRDAAIAMFARLGVTDVVDVPGLDDMPVQACMCFTGQPHPRTRGYILEFTLTAPVDPNQGLTDQ